MSDTERYYPRRALRVEVSAMKDGRLVDTSAVIGPRDPGYAEHYARSVADAAEFGLPMPYADAPEGGEWPDSGGAVPTREAAVLTPPTPWTVREAGAGHWVSITDHENLTTHIFVGHGGLVTKGPKHLIGANIKHLPPSPGRYSSTHHAEGHTPQGHASHPHYTEHQDKTRVYGKHGPGHGYLVDNPLGELSAEEAHKGRDDAFTALRAHQKQSPGTASPGAPATPAHLQPAGSFHEMLQTDAGRERLVALAQHALDRNLAGTLNEKLALHHLQGFVPQMTAWGAGMDAARAMIHSNVDRARPALQKAQMAPPTGPKPPTGTKPPTAQSAPTVPAITPTHTPAANAPHLTAVGAQANVAGLRAAARARVQAKTPLPVRAGPHGAATEDDVARLAVQLDKHLPPVFHALFGARWALTFHGKAAKALGAPWSHLSSKVAGVHHPAHGAHLFKVAPAARTSVAIHEIGHGIDQQLAKLAGHKARSHAPDFSAIYSAHKTNPKLWSYMRQNRSEMFAEGFSMYHRDAPSRDTLKDVAPTLHDFMATLDGEAHSLLGTPGSKPVSESAAPAPLDRPFGAVVVPTGRRLPDGTFVDSYEHVAPSDPLFRDNAEALATWSAARPGTRPSADVREQAAGHSGVMVALDIPQDAARALALPDGEPVRDLHLTLAFLGDRDAYTPAQRERLPDVVRSVAVRHPALQGRVIGRGTFDPSAGSDHKEVLYATVDVPGLLPLRRELVDALEGAGYEVAGDHDFVPHITLRYQDPGTPHTPGPCPTLHLGALVVAVGDDRRAVRLARSGPGHHGPGTWRRVGNARVFIENGVITKGPPALLGKDLSSVREATGGALPWSTTAVGAMVLPVRETDEAQGHWVTLQNGVHIYIEGGRVTKGPSEMSGKSADHVLMGQTVTHHPPGHDPTARGTPAHLAAAVRTEGGFTHQPFVHQTPTTGFMVSPYPDREQAVPIDSFTEDHLADYIASNADLLRRSDHFLGGWHNTDDRNVYLDISVRAEDHAQAQELAQRHNQYAYYDLAAGETVNVSGRG